MKSTGNDESLCIHRVDDYWWMDERCFLLLADYLVLYYFKSKKLKELPLGSVMFVFISNQTLFDNCELFKIKTFGESALLLSFAYPQMVTKRSNKSMTFESFYESKGRVQSAKIKFAM